mgnify:CR=1 FL=1
MTFDAEAVEGAVAGATVETRELHDDLAFKEGWQQWIGASRHGTILGALLARTQWQDGCERSGVLPGPTV